ncbi:MAG: Activator of Hsp90 ATPase 1-like protein [Sphingobacteriales bacterium]|nr:Activator of Hsp90 ATPase 1-like protein [Sphingobacteriales bacterium]
METQAIKKSMVIDASKEKIWKVLTEDQFTRIWYAAFSEGSYAETDWQVGSKAIFKDASNSGMVTKVTENKPYDVLSLEYMGILTNGVEDCESEIANQYKGGVEAYYLTEENGHVRLSIESDMSEEYFESMSVAWDNALGKIKELSESME